MIVVGKAYDKECFCQTGILRESQQECSKSAARDCVPLFFPLTLMHLMPLSAKHYLDSPRIIAHRANGLCASIHSKVLGIAWTPSRMRFILLSPLYDCAHQNNPEMSTNSTLFATEVGWRCNRPKQPRTPGTAVRSRGPEPVVVYDGSESS